MPMQTYKLITKNPAVAGIADRTGYQDHQGYSRSMIFISSERAYAISYPSSIAKEKVKGRI